MSFVQNAKQTFSPSKIFSEKCIVQQIPLLDSFSIIELQKSAKIIFAYPETSSGWLPDLNLVF